MTWPLLKAFRDKNTGTKLKVCMVVSSWMMLNGNIWRAEDPENKKNSPIATSCPTVEQIDSEWIEKMTKSFFKGFKLPK